MKFKINNSVCYITCLLAGLLFGSCTNTNYEEDAKLYKKEVPDIPSGDFQATEGGDGQVGDKPGEG